MKTAFSILAIATLSTAVSIYNTHNVPVPKVDPINYEAAGLSSDEALFAKRYVTSVQSTHHNLESERVVEASFCVASQFGQLDTEYDSSALKELVVLSVEESKSIIPDTKQKISDLIARYGLPDGHETELTTTVSKVAQKCAAQQWHASLLINKS